jgi:stage III sporulation protein SpoIIIAA
LHRPFRTACAAANLPILFLGRPGVGKTTAIREIARTLSDELRKRVVIVDTSNEIGGDGDVPHHAIGGARRMQVADVSKQHHVMVGDVAIAFY